MIELQYVQEISSSRHISGEVLSTPETFVFYFKKTLYKAQEIYVNYQQNTPVVSNITLENVITSQCHNKIVKIDMYSFFMLNIFF